MPVTVPLGHYRHERRREEREDRVPTQWNQFTALVTEETEQRQNIPAFTREACKR